MQWAGVVVTHRGCKQTFVSALPTLLRLAKAPGKVRHILGCQGQGHLHPVPDGAREVADLDWNVCPLDLLAAPQFGAVFALDRLAKIAPLDNWPRGYSAWAVAGLMAVREARGEG